MPREEQTSEKPQAQTCQGCAERDVLKRLLHHIGLIERRSDNAPDFSRLGAHLTSVYAPAYVEAGKLQRRVEFVKTAWLIYREELKDGKEKLSMAEAYNLAAFRLNWPRRPVPNAPIDRSLPSGDRS